MNDNVEEIGRELLKIRTTKGLTQENIRTATGLTPKQIVEIEKGRTNYTVGTLLSYLDAVDCDIVFKSKP